MSNFYLIRFFRQIMVVQKFSLSATRLSFHPLSPTQIHISNTLISLVVKQTYLAKHECAYDRMHLSSILHLQLHYMLLSTLHLPITIKHHLFLVLLHSTQLKNS